MSRWQRGLSSLGSQGGAGNSLNGASRLNASQASLDRQSNKSFEELKRLIHQKLVDKLDLSRVSDLEGDTLRREIRLVVERLCDTENPLLNRWSGSGWSARAPTKPSASALLRGLMRAQASRRS